MIYSFLRSVVEVQGHLAHVHALAHQVRKIYFMGSFINIPLVRKFLTEHRQGRNLIRPQASIFPLVGDQEEGGSSTLVMGNNIQPISEKMNEIELNFVHRDGGGGGGVVS